MAVAAAAVMALGAATLWLSRDPVVEPVGVETAVIQKFDFEVPTAAPTVENDGAVVIRPTEEPVFVPARIDEPVVTEKPAVADAELVELPTAAEPEPLFAGGFESGDLSEWDPST